MNLTQPEDLSLDNFFAVVDTAIEIQEKAEMSSDEEVCFPYRPTVMRYKDQRQVNSLDKRPLAFKYLHDAGCFLSFHEQRIKYPTGRIYAIVLNKPVFQEFYRKLLELEAVKLAPVEPEHEQELQDEPSIESEKLTLNLPVGTRWEDITIQFIDGENVRIFARNFDHEASFKEMGFQNNKKVPRTPNKQWLLFQILAVHRGLLTWESPKADATLKKTKQLLAEGLKRYFSINTDPFDDYRKEKGYRIKMHLVPVDEMVELPTAQASNSDDLGIDEELKQFDHR